MSRLCLHGTSVACAILLRGNTASSRGLKILYHSRELDGCDRTCNKVVVLIYPISKRIVGSDDMIYTNCCCFDVTLVHLLPTVLMYPSSQACTLQVMNDKSTMSCTLSRMHLRRIQLHVVWLQNRPEHSATIDRSTTHRSARTFFGVYCTQWRHHNPVVNNRSDRLILHSLLRLCFHLSFVLTTSHRGRPHKEHSELTKAGKQAAQIEWFLVKDYHPTPSVKSTEASTVSRPVFFHH